MAQTPEPIAIVGSGFRFPGHGDTPSKLWNLLRNPHDVLTPIPRDRFSGRGFYHKSAQYHGHSNVRESYFLPEEGAQRRFDAQFFGIHPAEAKVIDPQMRLLLEIVYEALEAGGHTIEDLQGSNTAVYSGLMSGDYEHLMLRDSDDIGTYHATGTTRSLMSNRISYFFDWHGPSLTIDTACSSSLIAVHQAVQQLHSGQSRVAVATGANLILDSQYYVTESKLQMLSPDSRSRMWDASANGYARGEGIAAIVLKTLRDAEADGDHIECIIRETGANQDGRTKGITMPCSTSQALLIRECYARIGLNAENAADRPQYFEAHRTGTTVDDPVEAQAINLAFPPVQDTVLYVGSIKTIIGHSEGAAGLAALIKASLALQNAMIPPNMLFNRLNPEIEPFYTNLHVPTSLTPWPTLPQGQPLRTSVNSFGFGGANAHAILQSYTPVHKSPPTSTRSIEVYAPFVFSAAAESSLARYVASFGEYIQANESTVNLRHLAYTLHSRRTRLPFKTAIAASSTQELCARLEEKLQAARTDAAKPFGVRAGIQKGSESRKPVILGIFTGQIAQWAGMGSDLIESSPAARHIIQSLESLTEELQKNTSSSRIDEAILSQPLYTAVQILQVNLLRATGVEFTAVIGHSSGKIGAAYAAGMISAEDAICIAYYRGLHSDLAYGTNGQQGAMMAVGSSFEDVHALCEEPELKGRVSVAAVNSMASVTVSGDKEAIEKIKIILEEEAKFARILKTEKAYHLHHMIPCSEPYLRSLGALGINAQHDSNCTRYSSVYDGKDMTDMQDSVNHTYWNLNMINPVLFIQAVQSAHAAEGPFDLAIEVGPHTALKGPALQTILDVSRCEILYTGLFHRGKKAVESFANGLGFLWTHFAGDSVNLEAYDRFVSNCRPVCLVKGLPTYAWNHENEFWHESRFARAVRTRPGPVHELLGHLTPDSTPQEMRWRHLLRPDEVPWLKGHRLQNQTVFPAAGYVVAAIEAIRMVSRNETVTLIEIRDLDVLKALKFDADYSSVETLFSLTHIVRQSTKSINAQFNYSAAASSSRDSLDLLASGRVQVYLGDYCATALPTRNPRPPKLNRVRAEDFYSSLRKAEYEYSGPFTALCGMERTLGAATGFIKNLEPSDMIIHPAILDAAFQSILLAHSFPGDGTLWSMHVPRTVRCIRINSQLCRTATSGEKAFAFDSVQPADLNSIGGGVDVYPERMKHAMIQVEGLDCIPFSRATAKEDKALYSTMIWNSASPDMEQVAYDGSTTSEQYQLVALLERAAVFYLRSLDEDIPSDHPTRSSGPFVPFYKFASHVLSLTQKEELPFWELEWQHDTHEQVASLCEPYAHVIDVKLLRAIGENLSAITKGEKKAIEIGMADDWLAQYYQNAVGMPVYTRHLARAIKQIVHRFPHMHILEIGAGTGGATKGIFAEIDQTFASYTFTDVSSGFFSAAQATFSDRLDKMIFKVLDISRSPHEQGLVEQSYDLVVASMVLHATPVLEETMRNARRLLRPGGFLVALEGYNNKTNRVGTIFGAFPGWWLGASEGRVLSPCVGLHEWDKLLRNTGFSGCDTVTPNPDSLVMPLMIFVSQAMDTKVSFLRDPLSFTSEVLGSGEVLQELLLLGGNSLLTSRLVGQLQHVLRPFYSSVKILRSFADLSATGMLASTTTVLSLTDLDEPIFKCLTEQKWEGLKSVLVEASTILWVTLNRCANSPYVNMTVGLLRSSARELPALNTQLLEVEDPQKLEARLLAEVLLRLKAAMLWLREDGHENIHNTVEPELVLNKQGQYLIPRLVPNQEMNDRYNSSRREISTIAAVDDRNVGVTKLGSETFLRHEAPTSSRLSAKAQIRVTHSMLSAVKVADLGCMFIVLGRDVESGKQMMTLSTTHTHLIHPWKDTSVPIMSTFGSRAKFLTLVAHHLLASSILKGFSKGDSIVVHEADPIPAEILLSEAKLREVNVVFTTSRTVPRQSEWLTIQPTAPERLLRGLFQRRISAFLDFSVEAGVESIGDRIRSILPPHCKRESLSTLFAEGSWSPLDAHASDIHGRLRNAITYAEQSIAATQDRISSKVPVVALSELSILDGELTPNSVVDWTVKSDVSIRVQPVDSYPLFSNSKTYWLAGLTGGLGLSLCEWMVRHGARYIVLCSRTPKVEESWMKKMDANGAVVKAVSCDITKKDQVVALHASILSTWPPIAGVAQGAMVLQDTAIGEMTFDKLSKVLRPKVEGSIHINDLFQENDLDFFVFFSSVSAVVGHPGQSNYAAANLFMKGLAEQRRQRGLAASIINIGPILGVGYISKEDIATKTVDARSNGYMAMSERDFHQLFAEAVISGLPGSGRAIEITTGTRTISVHADTQPGWAWNPIMSHYIQHDELASQVSSNVRSKAPMKAQLAQAQTRDQVSAIIGDSFIPKICALFQFDAKSLSNNTDLASLRLDDMGIDSLLAVEIRGWFMRFLGVNIPVLKILNGVAVDELIAIATKTIPPSLIPNVQEEFACSPLDEAAKPQAVAVSSSVSTEIVEDSVASPSSILSAKITHPSSYSSISSELALGGLRQQTLLPEPVLLASHELSIGQNMFWVLSAFLEDRTSLNHSASFRLTGRLRIKDLAEAVRATAQQHESLRTSFFEDGGRPMQGVMESSVLHLEHGYIQDEAAVARKRIELHEYAYDLNRGETIRIVLLSLSSVVQFLVLGANGLVMDGLSFQVFMKDLQLHYAHIGGDLKTSYQYSEYSRKQREDYATGKYEDALHFWKTEYSDFPPILPILSVSQAVSRPSLTAYENERVDIRIDVQTRALIQELCRHYRVTAFHFYLTAFRALLSRYTNADFKDVSIGIGDANRIEAETMNSIGMFLNLLPLRIYTQASGPFAALLQETRANAYAALANSHVPFQILLDELNAPRSATHTPIFQCFVDYRQGQREKTAWADCQLEMLSFQASKTAYDLALDIIDDPNGESLLMFVARKDLYDQQAAKRLAKSYELLIRAFAKEPESTLNEPALFEPAEIEKAMSFSKGPSHISQWPETVIHRIDNVVEIWPQEPAVLLDDGTVATYANLSNYINSIAALLQGAGIPLDSNVAVLQEPSVAWLASVLAVMRIGAIYLPLDLDTPWARLATILEDCQPVAVLLDDRTKHHAQELQCADVQIINVKTLELGKPAVPISATSDSTAMILYTSGSTGRPKGIILNHEGLRNWIEPTAHLYGVTREVVLQQSSSNFDMSFTQIATALCFGGAVYLLPRHLRGDAWAISNAIASKGISYTCATPSEYFSWLKYGMPELVGKSNWKLAVAAGEPISSSLLRQFASLEKGDLRLFNMYGPTEISLVATAMEISYKHEQSETVAAGYTLPNYSLYVVDEQLRPLPLGVQGEIYIGGAGVAAGYLKDPVLTAEKFVRDVFATAEFVSQGWLTMHRTGDIGRRRADGALLIEGRVSGDTQIKLRGLRIDLREIEKVIMETSEGMINEAVVTVRQMAPESPELLVAHVVCDHGCTSEKRARHLHLLRSRLPQYMCPAIILPIGKMPMTTSSKLDRKAIAVLPLPKEIQNTEDCNIYDAIELTETETRLRNIWAEVVPTVNANMPHITPNTDFFHAGGTSLLLLEVQAHVRAIFGVQLRVIQMFESSSLAGMAHRIEDNAPRVRAGLMDWDKETALPLSLSQLTLGGSETLVSANDNGEKVVVLTGATGFLGRALLAALVADSRVRTVHCIAVRQAGNNRDIAGLDKVILHDGDLTMTRVGLPEDVAHSIFSTTSLVIHNGADVSYLKTYTSLRPANLDSTKELAALCLPRRIPFHYISTAAVGMFAAATLGPESQFAPSSVATYPPPADVTLPASGHNYTAMIATKWASERFLERVIAEQSPTWPVYVHRPSLVARGDTGSVGWDVVHHMRHYARRLHAVPVIRTGPGGTRATGRLNLVALETVVLGVLQAALEASDVRRCGVQYLHHLGEVELPLGDLRSWVDQGGCVREDEAGQEDVDLATVEELPVEEWARRAAECGMHAAMVALFEGLAEGADIVFPRYVM